MEPAAKSEHAMPHHYLVTGANRGIGLEFCRQLAARGDEVTATCRNPTAAEELGELDVVVRQLDVTDAGSVRALAAASDRPIDVLVNNAGIGVRSRPLGRLDHDEFRRFLDVNAVGALRVVEALLPQLRRGERRVIANMTSRMGSIDDNTSGGAYAYRASKAALNMVTKSLSIDLAADGFTCVVLHPGWVRTAMGGPDAPVPVETSVSGLLRVLDNLDTADSGSFLDFTGQALPW